MKLHLANADGQHLITAYASDFIAINHQKQHKSLVLMPNTLLDNWLAHISHTPSIQDLQASDFDAIAALKPEVVLLGTGEKHHFLHPKIFSALSAQNIAVECMSTAAACRTYNILMSEGRNVAAALLVG